MHNRKYEVTIGIPVRNGDSVISYTLDNIFNSEFDKNLYEVIIGDHASTDKTPSILSTYMESFDVKVVNVSANIDSRAAVRNAILRKSQGRIVIFLDSDVLVSENLITEHLKLNDTYGESTLVAGYTYGKGNTPHNAYNETGIGSIILQDLLTSSISEKYESIKSNSKFYDYREQWIHPENNSGHQILASNSDPWRLFWSCNMSSSRKALLDLGGFDEKFVGWGHEDDDLAYRYYLNGATMIFSEKAWGFHVPHISNFRKNVINSRVNAEYFLRKYTNRDAEFASFGTFGNFPTKLEKLIERDFLIMPDSKERFLIVEKLGQKLDKKDNQSRLGIFMDSEEEAKILDLSHCFIPRLPMKQSSFIKDDRIFFSLLGVNTGFEDGEIDEVIIIFDLLMMLTKGILLAILVEMIRITKRLVLAYGSTAMSEDYADYRKLIDGYIDEFSFIETERIYL